MPLLKPKKNKHPKQSSLGTNEVNRKIRSKYYGSIKWRKLRLDYLMYHPLDEIDLMQGITTPAEDVHHITSFMSTTNVDLQTQLFYDWNNLIALSKVNHQKIHNDEEFKAKWSKIILQRKISQY